MRVEYLHASRFGNGAKVAQEFRRQLGAMGVVVEVHHIRDVRAKRLAPADLYVFSSPGRMGKPIASMRRFLRRLELPSGTRCAILTTQLAPQPNKKTGQLPSEDELARWQRILPIMSELLAQKGLVEVAADTVFVTAMRGPLEVGWQDKVSAFAAKVLVTEPLPQAWFEPSD